jgi:putative ABC transport system permease protein
VIFGNRTLKGWFSVGPETYVMVKENSSIETVKASMQDLILSHLGEEVKRDEYTIGFQPLTDIHLNPEIPVGIAPVSNPTYVYILGIIGMLVLLVASINYATLSIGKSVKRTHEVGMRKVLGATKASLVWQYLSESILVSLVSTSIGVSLAIYLVPVFNRLTGVSLVYQFDWWHVLAYLTLAVLIGILAGGYPAFILTNTRIMSMMKKGVNPGGRQWVSRGMMTFQFLITVLLVSSTLIMNKQIKFLMNKDLGYNYEAYISIPLFGDSESGNFFDDYASALSNGSILKQKIAKHPEFTNICMSSHALGTEGWSHLAFVDNDGGFRWFRMLGTDAHFIDSYGLQMVDGRGFEEGNTADKRQSIILNESAVRYFALENPIGDKLPGKNFEELRIIGVVKDFHYSSLRDEIEPLVITQNVAPLYEGASDIGINDSPIPKMQLKYTGSQLLQAHEILEKEWSAAFPNRNLELAFVEENIRQQYENEARLNKLIGVATIIAIIIASIGLLGLTVLVVNSREKEIGIRKIIGASPFQIFGLLAKAFSWQLAIGIGLSIPLTIWLMKEWLDGFAFRTSIGVDMFGLSVFISAGIALLVISFHAWKASRVNPVESLRVE